MYTFIAIYPLLYIDFYGVTTATANFYASLFGLFGIPFGVVAGMLIDKTQKPKQLIALSFIVMALSSIGALYLDNSNARFIIQLFCLSSSCSLASSSVTITVPKSVSEPLIGYAMSFVNLFYYSSIVIGPPLVMTIIEKNSWNSGIWVVFVGGLIGVVAAFIFMGAKNKEVVE
ncbi:MFS transporter [Vagococcus sp. BWB3-3]|uniref:MFS transporter n=1 Tax=Vagococcus allomyrinae TaxID=2794353 RepID=A0A940SSQ0_9ENTE|nr:MFS transporter [Vagococcus allomyrinae]MBP1039495.1 MFS transporter [Vagococcus allomyrinae]